MSPSDPEPYYWVGVINWELAYNANSQMRLTYNAENPNQQIQELEPLPADLREQYTMEFEETVDEGMQMLERAVELRPNYADAIAYQSLLLRQKANMAEGKMRAELEERADNLLDEAKAIKRRLPE